MAEITHYIETKAAEPLKRPVGRNGDLATVTYDEMIAAGWAPPVDVRGEQRPDGEVTIPVEREKAHVLVWVPEGEYANEELGLHAIPAAPAQLKEVGYYPAPKTASAPKGTGELERTVARLKHMVALAVVSAVDEGDRESLLEEIFEMSVPKTGRRPKAVEALILDLHELLDETSVA